MNNLDFELKDIIFDYAKNRLDTNDLNGDHFPLLQVKNLCKYFPIYSNSFIRKKVGFIKAVDNISFNLFLGKTLGLVGESGCGKTTVGRTILRAINPDAGTVLFDLSNKYVDICKIPEKKLKPLRTKMQMIFQDPYSSLNPRMTVKEIVSEPLIIHGLAKGQELEDRVAGMLQKVGLRPEYMHRYPHAFSGGQRQRIGIARALIMHPSLVVCDEAVSALDVSVQAQVINLLQDLQKELGLTYIFISHNIGIVKHICDNIAVMYCGKIVELAKTEELFHNPMHPYTRLLLSSVPSPDPDIHLIPNEQSELPDISNLPSGCSFFSRCPIHTNDCSREEQNLIKINDDHYVACNITTK
ncbi:MAG TPA: ATP-binding cassette domain-containing protein [Victivallales bacterium]|nr:ATP-binding cassette domain-containing protein [Victivallales bacterium]